MKLDDISSIEKLDFDIPARTLKIYHNDNLNLIKESIDSLDFDSSLIGTEQVELSDSPEDSEKQRKLLWTVLVINAAFFVIEMTTGWISGSMGLVADSLDMLADALVYGLSLIAVGGSLARKKNIAKLIGYSQIILTILGFSEVLRRFAGIDIPPGYQTMIIVSIFALIGNSISLYLLLKSKNKEVHIKASQICTSNDVIINSGVIVAGILVNVLNSNKPDLIIGSIVFIIVIRGALRILKLSK